MYGKKLILFLAAGLLLMAPAAGYIGTAPGVQYLGELERGQTYEPYFYVESDRSSSFLVQPTFDRPHSTLVEQGLGRSSMPFDAGRYSAEDMSSWLSFSQDTYQVNPDEERSIQLEGGGSAVVDQRIGFSVSVPEDAEPGYHARTVELNPQLTASGSGTASVSTVALTEFMFYFRVPGEAERDLKILGVNGIRSGDDQVRVDFLVRNNGTVTTDIESMTSTIYDQVGNRTGEVTVGAGRLAPGETRIAQTYWSSQDVEAGTYRVEGDLGYLTGNAYIDSTINVSDVIQVEQAPGEEPEEGGGMSSWLILMGLVLSTALMYYMEIDPVIIVLTVVAISASAFIMFSAIPNIAIGGVIVATVGVMIYGW
jgi:hypothetical protein